MRLAFVAPRRSGRRVIRLVRREGVVHYARFRGACTAAQRKRQNPPVQTACAMADLTRLSRHRDLIGSGLERIGRTKTRLEESERLRRIFLGLEPSPPPAEGSDPRSGFCQDQPPTSHPKRAPPP